MIQIDILMLEINNQPIVMYTLHCLIKVLKIFNRADEIVYSLVIQHYYVDKYLFLISEAVPSERICLLPLRHLFICYSK